MPLFVPSVGKDVHGVVRPVRLVGRVSGRSGIHVGRVGVLAVLLGVGVAGGLFPAVAFADSGSGGSVGSSGRGSGSEAGSASPKPRGRSPASVAGEPRVPSVVGAREVRPSLPSSSPRVSASPAMSSPVGERVVSWLADGVSGGSGSSDGGPVGWAVSELSRRQWARRSGVGAGQVWSYFFGNGTAEHPDGGVFIGNGYSWTAESCTGVTACTGGNGGLLGSGGDGYNGGNGGSAGGGGGGGGGGRPPGGAGGGGGPRGDV